VVYTKIGVVNLFSTNMTSELRAPHPKGWGFQ